MSRPKPQPVLEKLSCQGFTALCREVIRRAEFKMFHHFDCDYPPLVPLTPSQQSDSFRGNCCKRMSWGGLAGLHPLRDITASHVPPVLPAFIKFNSDPSSRSLFSQRTTISAVTLLHILERIAAFTDLVIDDIDLFDLTPSGYVIVNNISLYIPQIESGGVSATGGASVSLAGVMAAVGSLVASGKTDVTVHGYMQADGSIAITHNTSATVEGAQS